MARFGLSAMFAWVRGSVGGLTFSSCRGVPYVKQKPKKFRYANTKYQQKMRQIGILVQGEWYNLDLNEVAIWEEYAKVKIKTAMRKESWRGKGNGRNAFYALNHLLMVCGFAPIRKPPSKYIHQPPLPEIDLIDNGMYKGEIRFNVWLPYHYEGRCVCQVWLKKSECACYYYIRAIVPVTTQPTEVVIDKIRLREKGKVVEKDVKKIKVARLSIQLRTVAENGKFSMPSHIYRIEIRNT